MVLTPTLATMPVEILASICQYVTQQGLLSLMLCNSNCSEIAAEYLYMEPQFASTYRFAQFVFTVVNRQHYALLVRNLDLSHFNETVDSTGEFFDLAGWREFKYRHHDMFYVHRHSSSAPSSERYTSLATQRAMGLPFSPSHSTHPAPSPLLQSFHRCRDVPIGGIIHVLGACKRLKSIDFSRMQLASDFMVISPSLERQKETALATPIPYLTYFLTDPEHTKAKTTYVSDVPKSWTWQASELVPIYADAIVGKLCNLRELDCVKARNCVWLTTVRVWKLMKEGYRGETGVGGLERVDFRGSGMQKGIRWGVKGSREEVEMIVGEVVGNSGKNVA